MSNRWASKKDLSSGKTKRFKVNTYQNRFYNVPKSVGGGKIPLINLPNAKQEANIFLKGFYEAKERSRKLALKRALVSAGNKAEVLSKSDNLTKEDKYLAKETSKLYKDTVKDMVFPDKDGWMEVPRKDDGICLFTTSKTDKNRFDAICVRRNFEDDRHNYWVIEIGDSRKEYNNQFEVPVSTGHTVSWIYMPNKKVAIEIAKSLKGVVLHKQY